MPQLVGALAAVAVAASVTLCAGALPSAVAAAAAEIESRSHVSDHVRDPTAVNTIHDVVEPPAAGIQAFYILFSGQIESPKWPAGLMVLTILKACARTNRRTRLASLVLNLSILLSDETPD